MSIEDFAIPVAHSVKLKESEKRDKYLDFAGEQKTMEHEGDGDTSCNWCIRSNVQRLRKDLEIRRQVKTIPTIQTTALLLSARILRRVLVS